MKILRQLKLVLVVCGILSVLSLGLNFWVYHELQARLKIRMSGQYIPSLFTPAFEVRHGAFTWKDRVQLVDGNFKVQFDPLTLVSQQGIRIIMTSTASKIKLLGSWALQEGVEKALVDSIVADILLGRRGLTGINEVEVLSKSFQFSLKGVDKRATPRL